MRRRRPWPDLLERLRHDERGNMALLFAFLFAVCTGASALAVDEGALYLQRRQAQAAVDLAALAAAGDPSSAFARARAALVDARLVDPALTDAQLQSGSAGESVTVTAGLYTPDPSLPVPARFTAGALWANAAHVRLELPGRLYFARIWSPEPVIGVAATASAPPEVAFSVGSTLARLQDGLPNAILNALLGANVSLSAMSYDGLLNARVSVFRFLDALAQELDISAGDYDTVLAASADQGTIARALADVLTGSDALAAGTLARALGHNGSVPIGKLVDLGPAARLALGDGERSGLDADISALQMLAASAALSDGTHQVTLNLATGVPGLVGMTLTLAVGEPPQAASWFALGPSGTLVNTAQLRLRLVASVAGGVGLGNGVLRVPLDLDMAYASAQVKSAACPVAGASTGSATIIARPGIARLLLGDVADSALADFSRSPPITPAVLIDLPLLQVSASGEADIAATQPKTLAFSAADIENGVVKSASTTTIVTSLTGSLLSSLTVNVNALGLGAPSLGATKTLLATALAPLAPVVDSVIDSVLATLGLQLGVADVAVAHVGCGRPVLVG